MKQCKRWLIRVGSAVEHRANSNCPANKKIDIQGSLGQLGSIMLTECELQGLKWL